MSCLPWEIQESKKITKWQNSLFKNISGTHGLFPWITVEHRMGTLSTPHEELPTPLLWDIKQYCRQMDGNVHLDEDKACYWWSISSVVEKATQLHNRKKMAKFPKDLDLVLASCFLKLSSYSKANTIKMVMMCLRAICRATALSCLSANLWLQKVTLPLYLAKKWKLCCTSIYILSITLQAIMFFAMWQSRLKAQGFFIPEAHFLLS